MRNFIVSTLKNIGLYNTIIKLFPNLRKSYRFYKQFIRKGDLCFDIGANIGSRSEVFLFMGARVVAAEPQPVCIDILRKKFSNNSYFKLEPVALGAQFEKATLYICENFNAISTLSTDFMNDMNDRRFPGYKWNSEVVVDVITLDSLIDKYGIPRFCKIDVEGYEYFVLSGLHHKIPCIAFEFRKEALDVAQKCIALIEQYGKVMLNYSIDESYILEYPDFVAPNDSFWNKLQSSSEDTWGDIYVKCV